MSPTNSSSTKTGDPAPTPKQIVVTINGAASSPTTAKATTKVSKGKGKDIRKEPDYLPESQPMDLDGDGSDSGSDSCESESDREADTRSPSPDVVELSSDEMDDSTPSASTSAVNTSKKSRPFKRK